jgi:small subunit ribosomal protein S6
MQTYETLLITPPNLPEEDEKSTVDALHAIIVDGGGTIHANDRMGRRHLAYPIQKFDDGVFIRFLYDSEADVPKELERRSGLSDKVLRHLTVRLTTEWAEDAKKQAVLDAQRKVEAEAQAKLDAEAKVIADAEAAVKAEADAAEAAVKAEADAVEAAAKAEADAAEAAKAEAEKPAEEAEAEAAAPETAVEAAVEAAIPETTAPEATVGETAAPDADAASDGKSEG